MAHTYMFSNTTFICNPDLSGTVEIKTDNGRIEVVGRDLIAFVADYVRREKIAALEDDVSDQEILGLPRRAVAGVVPLVS